MQKIQKEGIEDHLSWLKEFPSNDFITCGVGALHLTQMM
jgi:hypothetical protein